MNIGTASANTSKHDTQKSDRKRKAFKDIIKYFSKEDWEEMGDFEKVTHAYMKRIFDAIVNLGLNISTPSFMHTNIWTPKMDDSDDEENQEEPPQMASSVQLSKLLKFIWDTHIEKMKSKKTSQNENGLKAMPGTAALMKTSGAEQPKEQPTPLGQHNQQIPEPMKKETNIWSHRLRERKYHVVYEEISEPNEDD
ncbi:PREDICTED: histone-lysine N-methyltransferase PRDM9-like [Chrysochloris asiatica]|uniref:Histone-lysine N-methyltransferase PRDM9-like n=1 Tax=Chrysochloris asiatica TaxID=185453 RepID=A0A9B0WQZ2_CHRAS|nr:PREDICTED: histone-lysine N-methyltransferase PRDM9-like [Chrysochloris asiatica]